LLGAFGEWLGERPADEDSGATGTAAKEWLGERGVKIGALFQPLRCALSGQPGGPDLFLMIGLLGRQEALLRIQKLIERLAQ
jgi:glutamyl-tRNA synthetase